jgi:hypothetical protein
MPAHDQFDMPFDDGFEDPEFDTGDDFDSPDDVPSGTGVLTENGTRTLTHPITGKRIRSPRASQFAKAVADDFTLVEWKIAMVALGLGKREDLVALAQSQPFPSDPVELRPKGWWTPWNEIAHQAMDAAEWKSGAHKGTAIHSWAEQFDRGQITLGDVPVRWRPHLLNLLRVREEAGLTVDRRYLETGVYTDFLHNGVNGRLDSLMRDPSGQLVTQDLKTGKQAPKGLDEIAVQLAIYANAEWHLDMETGVFRPAPLNVRKDVAVITWVPIDRPEAAEVIPVDIAWGWQAAKASSWLRAYRNRAQRKNNGLRLPLSALSQAPGTRSELERQMTDFLSSREQS